MQHVLLLDNFDSFTYNLEHYLRGLGVEVMVIRNNEPIENLERFDKVVLSPGPGLPAEAGGMIELLKRCDSVIPVLGVCLGMQGMAEYLGGRLYNQETVKHGVSEKITLRSSSLFRSLGEEIEVGLYHSWAVEDASGNFTTTALSHQNVVMALENEERKMVGVQFHPESIMTPEGRTILRNFLTI